MRGVYTALITPFNKNNEIDLPAYRRILKDQVAAGISGVVPCGTTGEAPTLSDEEKDLLILTAVEELKGSGVKVIAGTGSNDTAATVKRSKAAAMIGVDGVLVVTPYYNKPSQSGLAEHFLAVASAITCEVMLYNVPGRTSVSLTPATVASLAEHPRITTIKEATGSPPFTSEIVESLQLLKRKMDVLSGDDATYLPLLSVGAVGVVSVASNLFPRAMVAIHNQMEKGNLAEARRIHQQYFPLFKDLFVDSNPVPLKYAMAKQGWCENRLRLPLVPLSQAHQQTVDAAMARCELTKGTSA